MTIKTIKGWFLLVRGSFFKRVLGWGIDLPRRRVEPPAL